MDYQGMTTSQERSTWKHLVLNMLRGQNGGSIEKKNQIFGKK